MSERVAVTFKLERSYAVLYIHNNSKVFSIPDRNRAVLKNQVYKKE